MRPLRYLILVLIFSAAIGRAESPPTTAPGDETALPIEERFAAPPEGPDRLTELVKRLDAEMAAFGATTRPVTSQPTTQPDGDLQAQVDGWRLELWRYLGEWRARVRDCEARARTIAALAQDGEVTRLTAEINELSEKTKQVAGASLPWFVTEQDVKDAEAAYETQNQTIDALSATLKQQESLLAGGFKAQRERLRPLLEAARAAREQFDSTYEADLKASDSDLRRDLIRFRRRAAGAKLAFLETSRVATDLNEKRTQQESERNKLKRDALKPYVVALRTRMNALIESKSRGRADALRRRLEDARVSAIEKAYLRLQLLREENVARVHSQYANAIRDRFQTSTLQTLLSGVERDRLYWERFSASIQRRSAADILNAYRDAGVELRFARSQFDDVQQKLDLSITEQRQLDEMEARQLEQFAALQEEFRGELGRLGQKADEQANKWALDIGSLGLDIRNAYEEMNKLEQEAIARLTQGVTAAASHAALWEQARSRLYWAHLVTRGPGSFERRTYQPALAELQALRDGAWAESVRQAWNAARTHFAGLNEAAWVSVGFVTLFVLALWIWLQRLCAVARRAADALEIEDPAREIEFRVRLRNQLGSVGFLALPCLALLSLAWLTISMSGLSGRPRALADVLLGSLVALVLLEATLHILLHQSKARYRVIPCSSAVARHYRRCIRVVALLAIVFVLPALALDALELAPATRSLLVDWFQLASLFVFLFFLLRKNTVLNIFPRDDRSRYVKTVAVLRTLHPALLLLVIGLIGGQISGYQALVSYVGTGLVGTLGAVLAAFFGYQLFRDFMLWLVHEARVLSHWGAVPGRSEPVAEGAAPGAAAPGNDAVPPALHLLFTLTRWALAVGVLLASGALWGIRPYEIKTLLDLEIWRKGDSPVTLWRVGGSVLAIVVAIIVSRTLRQSLLSRFYPRYPGIDRGAQAAIDTLLHYVLIIVGVYISLETLRLDFGALAVLFGGLGLGVGLGLQPLVVNFVSGLLILFERHVKVGDVVVVGERSGEVTHISMRSTTIRTPDGLHVVIPNGDFINQRVENWTLRAQPIRGLLQIGVEYGSDPTRVRDTLLAIAQAEPSVLREPPPEVFFADFADSSLNFTLACWFYEPGDRWRGMVALRYAILKTFRERGINIPFPQREFSFAPGEVLNVRVNHAVDSPSAAPPNLSSPPETK